jgi:uncharacterized protein (DUF1810 family)
MPDAFDLARFVAAQDDDGTYDAAVRELRAGRKTTHWMWFVVPQIAGLASSPTARRYAISGREEATAYLAHAVLGARLRECAGLVAGTEGRTAEEIFGSVDAQKLQSSMTLFHRVDPDEPAFAAVIDTYFGGRPDPATDARL